jgi:hypothetical protein
LRIGEQERLEPILGSPAVCFVYRYSRTTNATAAPTAMPRASRAISLAMRCRFTYPLLSQAVRDSLSKDTRPASFSTALAVSARPSRVRAQVGAYHPRLEEEATPVATAGMIAKRSRACLLILHFIF